jgi:hypothetical protein
VKFGRLVNHDPQNREYAFPETGSELSQDFAWRRFTPILDQGNLGCCTCAALVGALGTAPLASALTDTKFLGLDLAHALYTRATQLDDRGPDGIPGHWPPTDTGSSGLAAAKAAKEAGLIDGYRWVFTERALRVALNIGPVIMGMAWYEGMSEPDADGRLWPAGSCVGGHEILVRGIKGTDLVVDNSWGASWGDNGSALLPWEVFRELRHEQLDITVPLK